ncbi:hypothetical protein crov177 [Cafeteria roenbergensis virus]|uniref:Uncharacterized protein n=1 Tax=Cafeteria roenbergensis virus (strain BV-PW1) TaxID=693272 RepID=E3T4U7_CROVB|nr:hypothetical protein crov177 [Cafeteria roenbergensis virus BV-PW1]ADO67210.1 hypothetical protein crov177 [Cafeteria roenbergensis virus BV-PW1]
MSLMYYWIRYNKESKNYKIAASPCAVMSDGAVTHISLVRDIDFCGKINFGEDLELKLVCIHQMNHFKAQCMVLNHFNKITKTEQIISVHTHTLSIPSSIDKMVKSQPSDHWYFDTMNYTSNFSHACIRASSPKFSINLRVYDDGEEYSDGTNSSYLYFSHPYMRLDT